MAPYIDVRIDENRNPVFDGGAVIGGDHLTHILRIDLEGSPLAGADSYRLIFETSPASHLKYSNLIVDENSSPAYVDGDVICCPLTRSMTAGSALSVQVEARYEAEDGETGILLSGIGRMGIGSSLAAEPADEESIGGDAVSRITDLETRVRRLESGVIVQNYAHTAAAAAANLLFESDEKTPIWYPETFEELGTLTERIIGEYLPGSGVRHMIITPAEGVSGLLIVGEEDGRPDMMFYRGKELLELMKGA